MISKSETTKVPVFDLNTANELALIRLDQIMFSIGYKNATDTPSSTK